MATFSLSFLFAIPLCLCLRYYPHSFFIAEIFKFDAPSCLRSRGLFYLQKPFDVFSFFPLDMLCLRLVLVLSPSLPVPELCSAEKDCHCHHELKYWLLGRKSSSLLDSGLPAQSYSVIFTLSAFRPLGQSADGTIGLPGSAHAEAALARLFGFEMLRKTFQEE